MISHGLILGNVLSMAFGGKNRLHEPSFIQYGGSEGDREEIPAAVHEKVAEILKTGVVRFD